MYNIIDIHSIYIACVRNKDIKLYDKLCHCISHIFLLYCWTETRHKKGGKLKTETSPTKKINLIERHELL